MYTLYDSAYISSGDLVKEVAAAGRDARFGPDRADLPASIAEEARPGDLVLVMGARDPSLTASARPLWIPKSRD